MFPGFTAADFDAYQAKKWKSNVFNRERLEVKQKLASLGRELQGAMIAPDGSPLAVEESVEHPALWNHKQVEAQHLYFSRNEGARKELDAIIERGKSLASMIDDPTPQRNHLFLAVTLTEQTIELSLKLHPDARVDRENLERKCEDHFEREKLLNLLRGLGQGYNVGITPELTSVAELDDARLIALMQSLGKPAQAPVLTLGTPQRLFYVGRAIPRAEATAAGAALADEAKTALQALLPVYRFISWSRENDFLSIKETLQKEKQQKRQKGLAKNDAVRIIRGMFSGKQGVVQEVDAKGGVRILVGKVAVKLDADDVAKS
ncbi:MAG: TolA protein [Myxococcales bacterium]|nr:TolA protein [Myxococcales bacterium]